MTAEEIDQAVDLYRAGDSIKTIATKLGKAKGSVWKALTNSGWRRARRHGSDALHGLPSEQGSRNTETFKHAMYETTVGVPEYSSRQV
ncbi:hypothetical protein [Nocardia farcinica]|uniref:hypothetical protein n=1 Tax=Nocardia farcinica TaxID=37329 RepID=UPI0018946C5B|nr:hypothetical protein [Nocardia farcinica]MBF6231300.1 hypothetical protein [Nocardia farcinica]